MSYVNGHVFLQWPVNYICFSKAELQRLHLNVCNPSAGKIFSILRHALPDKSDSNVKRMIDEISKSCQYCCPFSARPFRFRASISPDKVRFNHELAIDLLSLDGALVIHIVDTHTHYQNYVPIRSKRASDIWYAFVEWWDSVNVFYQSVLRLHQEVPFCSEFFKDVYLAHGIDLRFSGFLSNNSIGPGKIYHAPLRRVFRIPHNRYPSLYSETVLRYSVKEINNSVSPERLVTYFLVYGNLPTFPIGTKYLPGQSERLAAMRCARDEISRITSELRIRTALKSKLPLPLDAIYISDNLDEFTERNIDVGRVLFVSPRYRGIFYGSLMVLKNDHLVERR